MANLTLPDPFAWQDHFAGQVLTLRGRTVAFVTPLPNGCVRSTRKVHTRDMAHSFHDGPALAARFLEAWLRR